MLLSNKKIFYFVSLIFIVSNVYSLQFGNGNDESSLVFIQVADQVKDFCIQNKNTYLIKDDDSLWGAGQSVSWSFKGTSGYIDSFEKLEEDVLSYDGLYLIKKDGNIYETFEGVKKCPYDVLKGSGPFFIKKDYSLWVSGENKNGSFGTGSFEVKYDEPVKVRVNVIDICYNNLYSLLITSKHELMITGSHYLPSPYQKTCKFIKIADNVKYVIKNFYITDKDELYAFGWAAHGVSGLGDLGEKFQILPTKIMDNVESVASNGRSTLILKKDGKVYGCGGKSVNYCGELGFGNFEPVFTPKYIMDNVRSVGMGDNYSAILKKDGTLWMCGANNDWEGSL